MYTAARYVIWVLQILFLFPMQKCDIDSIVCPVAEEGTRDYHALCQYQAGLTGVICHWQAPSGYRNSDGVTGANYCLKVLEIPFINSTHRNLKLQCTVTYLGTRQVAFDEICYVQVFRTPSSTTCEINHLGSTSVRLGCKSTFVYPGLVCKIHIYNHIGNTVPVDSGLITYSVKPFVFKGAEYYNAKCMLEYYPQRPGEYSFTAVVSYNLTGEDLPIGTYHLGVISINRTRSVKMVNISRNTECLEGQSNITLTCQAEGFLSPPDFKWYLGNFTYSGTTTSSEMDGESVYKTQLYVNKSMITLHGSEQNTVVTCGAYSKDRQAFRWRDSKEMSLPRLALSSPHIYNHDGKRLDKIAHVAEGDRRTFVCKLSGAYTPGVLLLSVHCWTADRTQIFSDTTETNSVLDFSVHGNGGTNSSCICTVIHKATCFMSIVNITFYVIPASTTLEYMHTVRTFDTTDKSISVQTIDTTDNSIEDDHEKSDPTDSILIIIFVGIAFFSCLGLGIVLFLIYRRYWKRRYRLSNRNEGGDLSVHLYEEVSYRELYTQESQSSDFCNSHNALSGYSGNSQLPRPDNNRPVSRLPACQITIPSRSPGISCTDTQLIPATSSRGTPIHLHPEKDCLPTDAHSDSYEQDDWSQTYHPYTTITMTSSDSGKCSSCCEDLNKNDDSDSQDDNITIYN